MSPRNRFYGFALLGSSLLWLSVLFVHWRAQRRVSSRFRSDLAALSSKIEELKSKPVTVSSSSALAPASPSPVSAFPFRVLGSGRLGDRWAYLDIRHVDGSKRRYYCRVEDGMRGVQRMFSIIDADAYDADFNLLALEDAAAYASMPSTSVEPLVD